MAGMKLPEHLILKQMEIGPINNFLYFVGDDRTKEIVVIDPAWDVEYLCNEAKRNGYKITAVWLTHGHPDHVNGLAQMLSKHDVPAYISKHEAAVLIPKHKNIITIEDRSKLKVGSIEFETFWAPGHSPGCQIFLYKNAVITGDVIFIDGCGRCDLPGSDPKKQYHSLYNIVMKFADNTLLFTGHNYGPAPYATIGEQKKTNPYLLCNSLEEFLEERMGIIL